MLEDITVPTLFYRPAALLLFLPIVYIIAYSIHRLYFHPLSRIPGPLHRRLSSIPLFYSSYIGNESSIAASIHKKHGPVVLVGPDDVSISDSDAINPIYIEKGGFGKPSHYNNFNVNGFETIFSTMDHDYRATRAKPVMGIFATGRIRVQCEEGGCIKACTRDFVEAFKAMKASARSKGRKKTDVLELCRRFAVDSVCSYMYGRRYGAFSEMEGKDILDSTELSAVASVETFVEVGRLFLLPPIFYGWADKLLAKLSPNPQLAGSEAAVERYISEAISNSADSDGTFQSRLLDAGISRDETLAQSKDLFYAGADSTSTNIAKLMWQLCRHPHVLSRLRQELQSVLIGEDVEEKGYASTQTQTPYLHAVIKEGLRISMATPTRLARAVPESGWWFKGYYLPAGTRVGCASYVLHSDSNVFYEPMAFRPERWFEDEGTKEGGTRGESERLSKQRAAWMPFGAGTRQCIARTLATEEVTIAIRDIVLSGALDDVKPVGDELGLVEWFNSKVPNNRIELDFSG